MAFYVRGLKHSTFVEHVCGRVIDLFSWKKKKQPYYKEKTLALIPRLLQGSKNNILGVPLCLALTSSSNTEGVKFLSCIKRCYKDR